MPRLRRSDRFGPGITRVGAGRGFFYRDAGGRKITDDDTLQRIRDLALPPAWKQVWICPDPRGHLQATGIDAAGRTQYRYHDQWRRRRDRQKFERMLEFAEALPKLRTEIDAQLQEDDAPTRDRVLAAAVRLIDLGCFRVGSDSYASENGTYGMATLQRDHVRVENDERMVFDYVAKGGQPRTQIVIDDAVLTVVKRLKRRRDEDPRLLAYRADDGWHVLHAEDVNGFLEQHAGPCTAKDFRTWNATVLAAIGLAERAADAVSRTAHRRAIRETIADVAELLGNTPAVARSSYIDPRVFDRYDSGWTIAGCLADVGGREAFDEIDRREPLDAAVRDLIRDEGEDSPALSDHPVDV
ncbi:MAG: DNA topoisomerase IB [Patulibacter sp.]|nr:DNA topoisomerase IB [Patulibacter sp.]